MAAPVGTKVSEFPKDFGESNFGSSNYLTRQGKPKREYRLSRDGFTMLANPRDALQRIKDLDGVSQADVTDSLGRSQPTSIVSEAGLYMLVFGSSKPEAQSYRPGKAEP